MPVLPIASHADVPFDLIIVATLDRSGQRSADLLQVGVAPDKLFRLRKDPQPVPRRARSSVRARSTNGKHS